LLFLDEVTSGLDEQTDRDLMELFRQVADGGKTVVCITHNLANVAATCHLVVILTEGGRLAFVGTPDEALKYFGIARLGDVYRKLGEQKPEHWQAQFTASPPYARYVRDRLPAGVAEARHVSPSVERKTPPPSLVGQSAILTQRYLAIWRGDALALGAMLGQSLLVAILLALVFGKLADIENPAERVPRTVNLLFLLTISSFWFGCNNASKELVKERVIFSRERDFNLRTSSYLASKLLVLTSIGVIQITLLYAIVKACCGPPGAIWQQWLALAVLATAGTALGLFMSAFARTEEVAVALVPIAVIPQIILAGAIAPLSGFSKVLAKGGISAYWGKQALDSLLPKADSNLLGLSTVEFSNPLAVLAAHAAIFTVLTALVLWQSGRKAA
ncbi:MAG TPA: ABC transporter permease, partial [Planctomycetaceae bacterium]